MVQDFSYINSRFRRIGLKDSGVEGFKGVGVWGFRGFGAALGFEGFRGLGV